MVDEYRVDSLPYKDYHSDKNKRLQVRFIGSGNAAIRGFDFRDKRDMVRMRILDRLTLDDMDAAAASDDLNSDGSMTDKGLRTFVRDRMNREGVVIAVVASGDHPRKQERGEVQGFMYLSEHEDIQEVKDWQEKSVLPGGNVHIWEITWAKKKDAKEKQMADGVRQALGQIARSVVTFRESVSDEHQITSVRPEYPVSIFASIETNNVSSRWVAQRSGFEQKTANIWVLNWQRLEDIIHEKIDHQLLELAEKPTK